MEKKFYNLSNPQQALMLTEQYYHGTNINNICGTAIIDNILDFEKLDKAINELIKTNDSFRIKIEKKNGTYYQTIKEYNYSKIELVKLASKNELPNLENSTLKNVFDIENKLFEAKMFVFPDKTGGFMFNIHHVIADGWTLGLLCRKVMIEYSKLMGEDTEDISSSYIEYLHSEEEYFKSNKFENDKKYWANIFETVPESVTIPGSLNSNEISSKANRKEFILSKSIVSSIQDFCAQNKISIFNFFTAILSTYMYKINNIDNFVIGTPILNRTNFKEKNTTGMFVNVAPLRVTVDNSKKFIEFTNSIAHNSKEMLRHQKYAYSNILEDLRKKDPSIPGLYNIVLSYQLTKANNVSNYNYVTRWVFNGNCSEDIELQIYDLDETGSLNLAFDYKENKYLEKDIENLYNRLLYIINQILENNEIKLYDIEFATKKERDEILNKFNNTKTDYPEDKSVIELFEEQVKATPQKPAVFFENTELSYEELNNKANSIASHLIENGVQKEDVIGIFLDKCLESIISILGILKAGCAFLPIDVAYPDDRIDYMISHSKAKFILTNSNFKKKLNTKVKTINLDNFKYEEKENLKLKISPQNLAYIMYTSGSTGKPKGVMVEHRNIVRLVKNTNYIKFGENEKILQTGSIVFDACTFEIWSALLNGFELFIITKNDLLDPISLQTYIDTHKITILWLTSPLFNQLSTSNPYIFTNVKYLLTGGDTLSPSHINSVMEKNPNLQIINGYGPTENTTFSTCFNIKEKYSENIPIGHPISNSTCYIVNNEYKLCPIQTVGELIVGGDGVSRGYLNAEDLTKDKFISNLFGEKRVYKTGDLAKWLSDGSISFLGRSDGQVKIRGNRIELNEINSKILEFGNIKECACFIKEINGAKTICAYYVENSKISTTKLRDFLRNSLPSFMIPSYFIKIGQMPLNANGKIDKKLLPEPNIEHKNRDIVKPRNSIDKFIVKTLKNLLEVPEISIDDSFFDLGGDSLNAINFCSIVNQKFNVHLAIQEIFKTPVISELSDKISNLSLHKIASIKKVKQAEFYPTSPAQKRIYFASMISDTNTKVYNITGGLELSKKLDIKKTENIFNELIKRHESLRTYFEMINGELVQKILDSATIKVEKFDSTHLTKDELFNEFDRHFDLSEAPLIRVGVYNSKDSHMLLLSLHHIIADGTSLQILVNEFCKLYNGEKLNNLKITYKDYSEHENNLLKTSMINSKNYWVNTFKDGVDTLNLPLNYTRPPLFTFNGAKIYEQLDSNITNKVLTFCRVYNVTPFMFLISVFYVLLNKYSNNIEITIGTPIANRNLPDVSNVVGMFVNTLALKNNINTEDTFLKFLGDIKSNCIEAFSHQEYPFDELVRILDLPKNISRNPLFDVMFTYQNNGDPEVNLNEITAKYLKPDTGISKFDLSLEVIPKENELELNFEYCTDLFNKKFIEEFASHYITLLENIIEEPHSFIKDLDILSTEEQNKILYSFNNNKLSYPNDKSIPEIFETIVKKYGNKKAIIFEDTSITFKELDKKSNDLANYLIQSGIKKGDIVGILLNRSIEIFICIIGILKSGAAYIPIDPKFPEHRIKYILENSNSKYILSEPKVFNNFNMDCNIINVKLNNKKIYNNNNEKPDIKIYPEDLSYIIYTSGSTGNPKGVMLTHRGVINLTYSMNNRFKFDNNYNMVSLTTVSFDAFVFESLYPLCIGMTIVMANNDQQNITPFINNLCIENDVKIIQSTPSRYTLFLNDKNSLDFLKNAKYIFLGGEAVSPTLINNLKTITKAKLINAYGPTECTVNASFKDLTDTDEINIGKPVNNSAMYILDNSMKVLPVGVPGTLYISGDGVGKGYINRENLTKEKFIDDPFLPGNKMYNTGDIAKFLPNGDVHYIGRSDFQVKIHGLRIELEEIEKQISNYDDISSAVVAVKKDNFDRDILCGYFVADKKIKINKLKEFLRDNLPEYMVPVYIKQLDNFKYTPNGKIDRKLLPNPKFVKNSNTIIKPENDTEKLVAKIVENVLSIRPISITDNFFDLGADSLTMLRIQIDLLSEGINIPYSDIFKYNTIKSLSLRIISNVNTKVSLSDNNYDYTAINNLLNKNTDESLNNLKKEELGNVILTGATGFLGSHILNEILSTTKHSVYCLVRPGINGLSAKDKLKGRLNTYFGNKYDNEFDKRIFIIESDICEEDLKIRKSDYELLKNNTSCIINSAANVKHYGYYSDFKKINIDAVKNLIKFALDENKKFIQISTMSVSGSKIENKNNPIDIINYTEKDFFVNQIFDNIYIYSKFEAEKIVYENIINNNLNGLVLRVGNIMPRYSDGIFQINKLDNAQYNRLQTLFNLRCISEGLRNLTVEFTPVDLLANSIVKTIENYNNSINVLHLYNPNYIIIENIIKIVFKKPNIVSDQYLKDLIKQIIKTPKKKQLLSHIINDLDEDFNLEYNSDIKENCNFSLKFLKKLNFKWPNIDKTYIKKILYLFDID